MNKLYVGVHKGTPDDGYVCSGKLMLQEYKVRPEDFSREIVAFGSYQEMYIMETAILKAAKADKDPGFYNQHLNTGKFTTAGTRMTTETKNKIRTKALGRPAPNRGIPHSDSTKEKMKAAVTDIRRESIRERGLMNRGRLHTESAKAAIGQAQVGRKDSTETINKRALSNTGKKRSPETRERIRQAALLRGRK